MSHDSPRPYPSNPSRQNGRHRNMYESSPPMQSRLDHRESRLPGVTYDASEMQHNPETKYPKYPKFRGYREDHDRNFDYSTRFPLSPGQTPDNGDSAFGGMYSQSDSKYRWRKVRGNLDLFVMERNERHLTSLQWKWQKMSRGRARRRTPGFDHVQQNGLYSNPDKYWERRNPYSEGQQEYSNYGYVPEYARVPPHHQRPHQDMPMQDRTFVASDTHRRYRAPWESKDYSYTKPDYGLKMYYEEQMKLAEERRKNEESIAALQQEQQEMEEELLHLREKLAAELQRQKESPELSVSLNEKIDKIQEEIAELNEKLSENEEKLKRSEEERQDIHTRQVLSETSSSKYGSEDYPRSPLFIIGDPSNGTAAAVAPGRYVVERHDGGTSIGASGDSVFYEPDAYNDINSSAYALQKQQAELEEQAQRELQFKNELEKQMESLKSRLEEQMENSAALMKEENGKIIDDRVTNLEKQIAEMTGKIRDSDSAIRRARENQKTREEALQKERKAWLERLENDRQAREKDGNELTSTSPPTSTKLSPKSVRIDTSNTSPNSSNTPLSARKWDAKSPFSKNTSPLFAHKIGSSLASVTSPRSESNPDDEGHMAEEVEVKPQQPALGSALVVGTNEESVKRDTSYTDVRESPREVVDKEKKERGFLVENTNVNVSKSDDLTVGVKSEDMCHSENTTDDDANKANLIMVRNDNTRHHLNTPDNDIEETYSEIPKEVKEEISHDRSTPETNVFKSNSNILNVADENTLPGTNMSETNSNLTETHPDRANKSTRLVKERSDINVEQSLTSSKEIDNENSVQAGKTQKESASNVAMATLNDNDDRSDAMENNSNSTPPNYPEYRVYPDDTDIHTTSDRSESDPIHYNEHDTNSGAKNANEEKQSLNNYQTDNEVERKEHDTTFEQEHTIVKSKSSYDRVSQNSQLINRENSSFSQTKSENVEITSQSSFINNKNNATTASSTELSRTYRISENSIPAVDENSIYEEENSVPKYTSSQISIGSEKLEEILSDKEDVFSESFNEITRLHHGRLNDEIEETTLLGARSVKPTSDILRELSMTSRETRSPSLQQLSLSSLSQNRAENSGFLPRKSVKFNVPGIGVRLPRDDSKLSDNEESLASPLPVTAPTMGDAFRGLLGSMFSRKKSVTQEQPMSDEISDKPEQKKFFFFRRSSKPTVVTSVEPPEEEESFDDEEPVVIESKDETIKPSFFQRIFKV